MGWVSRRKPAQTGFEPEDDEESERDSAKRPRFDKKALCKSSYNEESDMDEPLVRPSPGRLDHCQDASFDPFRQRRPRRNDGCEVRVLIGRFLGIQCNRECNRILGGLQIIGFPSLTACRQRTSIDLCMRTLT